jgi:hypothetical protein
VPYAEVQRAGASAAPHVALHVAAELSTGMASHVTSLRRHTLRPHSSQRRPCNARDSAKPVYRAATCLAHRVDHPSALLGSKRSGVGKVPEATKARTKPREADLKLSTRARESTSSSNTEGRFVPTSNVSSMRSGLPPHPLDGRPVARAPLHWRQFRAPTRACSDRTGAACALLCAHRSIPFRRSCQWSLVSITDDRGESTHASAFEAS